MYLVLADTQVGLSHLKAGQIVDLSPLSAEQIARLRFDKVVKPMPTQDNAYPCVDYRDELYLCGGKRLIKPRVPK
ncbi:hypothetical protein [Helicobacter bizzozeronii]|uniref:Uncharacterized protein n=1 Tax=Helicobacter bizzozeronii (strain CIII-1) TaxID=1002804 RepID=F8KQG7_HELBC|nr:hypothetical protein [Helicobacter bizzozeronii]CCB80758.1 hypothetical protein HBZC1_17720 [Helicobacter bizzozeronii CIII-1]